MPFAYQSIYLDDPIVDGRALDIFAPEHATRPVAVFLVHGGGWRAGSRAGMHALMRGLNREGFVCAATDYRLAGVTITDQITDVRHGYDLFVRHLGEGGRPVRVAVFGSSAGAHLASLLALTRPGECGEDAGAFGVTLTEPWQPPVGAVVQSTPVTFEPWDDIFPHIWTSMQGIVGRSYDDAPEAYRRVSPIEHVGASSPPFLFLEAEHEHMFPLELTLRFVRAMEACGRGAGHKVYTRAEHGFLYDLTRRQQKAAFGDMLDFLASLAR